MRRTAGDLDFELQAAVVAGGDEIGEAGADRVIRFRNSAVEDPLGADEAGDFLVVGQVQLDRAGELGARRLERHQGRGVGREVGLGDRGAPAIHLAVPDDAAIGIDGPPVTRRHRIAVGVEGDHGPGAEPLAHD